MHHFRYRHLRFAAGVEYNNQYSGLMFVVCSIGLASRNRPIPHIQNTLMISTVFVFRVGRLTICWRCDSNPNTVNTPNDNRDFFVVGTPFRSSPNGPMWDVLSGHRLIPTVDLGPGHKLAISVRFGIPVASRERRVTGHEPRTTTHKSRGWRQRR